MSRDVATLCEAARAGDEGAVRDLLLRGVPVDEEDQVSHSLRSLDSTPLNLIYLQDGSTALVCASAKNHTGIVTFLLERGANIHHQTKVPPQHFCKFIC